MVGIEIGSNGRVSERRSIKRLEVFFPLSFSVKEKFSHTSSTRFGLSSFHIPSFFTFIPKKTPSFPFLSSSLFNQRWVKRKFENLKPLLPLSHHLARKTFYCIPSSPTSPQCTHSSRIVTLSGTFILSVAVSKRMERNVIVKRKNIYCYDYLRE